MYVMCVVKFTAHIASYYHGAPREHYHGSPFFLYSQEFLPCVCLSSPAPVLRRLTWVEWAHVSSRVWAKAQSSMGAVIDTTSAAHP